MAKDRLFGTDGVRGEANRWPIRGDTVLKIAMAAACELRETRRHLAIIGKDTRLSGYMLEPALTAGFISMGMDVVLVGPMPTPAVAMLTRSLRGSIGVMISASHNPYQDNGIKLFDDQGRKLSDTVQRAIEKRVAIGIEEDLFASSDHLGRAVRLEDARGRYIEHAKSFFPKGTTLKGMKVVVDCANGALYKIAPTVLWELGAEVIAIGTHPDGTNINRDCGVTALLALQQKVLEVQADIGIAYDGDGDRLMLIDERGETLDGDDILALIADQYRHNSAQGSGQAKESSLCMVGTMMSNMGLERFCSERHIRFERAQVGDRYVRELMDKTGAFLGGEPSGHIILGANTTTGDGLVAGLYVLSALIDRQIPASAIQDLIDRLPQFHCTLACTRPSILEDIRPLIDQCEDRLHNNGSLVIRQSGTEPVIRIMAQSQDKDLALKIIHDLRTAIGNALQVA